MRNMFYVFIVASVLWISGCGDIFMRMQGATPEQIAQLKSAKPMQMSQFPPRPECSVKAVAVLPMINNTNDIEAPEKIRDMFIKKISHNCYLRQPIDMTDDILKDELGITLGSQLDMTNPQKLGKKLDVDFVIYGALFNFEEKTTGGLNIRRIRAGFKMVDVTTGQVVWSKGLGVKNAISMTKGIARVEAAGASAVDKLTEDKSAKGAEDYSGLQDWHDLLPSEQAMGEKPGEGGLVAVKKAAGAFLQQESEIMLDRIINTLPLGTVQYTQFDKLTNSVVAMDKHYAKVMSGFGSLLPEQLNNKSDYTADIVYAGNSSKIAKLGDKLICGILEDEREKRDLSPEDSTLSTALNIVGDIMKTNIENNGKASIEGKDIIEFANKYLEKNLSIDPTVAGLVKSIIENTVGRIIKDKLSNENEVESANLKNQMLELKAESEQALEFLFKTFSTTIIVRPDMNTTYVLYPNANMYQKYPFEKDMQNEISNILKVEKTKKIGEETIDGHPCDKFQVKIMYTDVDVAEGYIWEAKDLDRFVIRTEIDHNRYGIEIIEMKNVKFISPPKDIFKVPNGYIKIHRDAVHYSKDRRMNKFNPMDIVNRRVN